MKPQAAVRTRASPQARSVSTAPGRLKLKRMDSTPIPSKICTCGWSGFKRAGHPVNRHRFLSEDPTGPCGAMATTGPGVACRPLTENETSRPASTGGSGPLARNLLSTYYQSVLDFGLLKYLYKLSSIRANFSFTASTYACCSSGSGRV